MTYSSLLFETSSSKIPTTHPNPSQLIEEMTEDEMTRVGSISADFSKSQTRLGEHHDLRAPPTIRLVMYAFLGNTRNPLLAINFGIAYRYLIGDQESATPSTFIPLHLFHIFNFLCPAPRGMISAKAYKAAFLFSSAVVR